MKQLKFLKKEVLQRAYGLLMLMTMILPSCKTSNTGPDKPNEQVFAEPVIDFTWAGEQSAPATIVFTNNTQNATSYKWDFGNGQIVAKQFPGQITFGQPGTFDIVLTAVNGDKRALLKKTIVITPNADPVAHFSYTFKNQQSYVPATVVLTNESVNADTFEWDINGTKYYNNTPTGVLFNQPGDYKIRLTVSKGGNRSSAYEETVSVAVNTNPIASFALNYHPYPYTAGEEVQFVNKSLNSDSWVWTFGSNGPASSTAEHPSVKFTAPGTYAISLVAKKGTVASAPRTITIKIN